MLENIFKNIKELKNKDSDWMEKMMTLTKRIADTDIKQLILKNVNTSTEILNSLEEVKQNTSSIGKVKKIYIYQNLKMVTIISIVPDPIFTPNSLIFLIIFQLFYSDI